MNTEKETPEKRHVQGVCQNMLSKDIYGSMRDGFYKEANEALITVDKLESAYGIPEIRKKIDDCMVECQINLPLFDEYNRAVEMIHKGERTKGVWNLEKLLEKIETHAQKERINTSLVGMIKRILS